MKRNLIFGANFIFGLITIFIFDLGPVLALDDRSVLGISASSGLEYTITVVLTDPLGRRAGLESVQPNLNSLPAPLPGIIQEIPHSDVIIEAIDDHVTNEPQPPALQVSILENPVEGIYKLDIGGTTLAKYRVGILADDKTGKSTRLIFQGVTDSGLKSTYQTTYSTTPGVPTTTVRVATFSSANQDIELAFKVDWIKNAGLKNSLLQKLQNAEADQGRGDIKSAKNTLNAFINEVKAQTGKGIDSDASTMLEQDANYLINHL